MTCIFHQAIFTCTRTVRQVRAGLAESAAVVSWHAYTLLLFTYTDYKTIVFPVAAFALVAAPVHSPARFLEALLWIWLHLLQCNVSNQCSAAEDDRVDRPWRPIPAGRVTSADAFRLRIGLVPLCLFLSAIHGRGVLVAGAGLTLVMIAHDDVGLARHWAGKNACTAVAYLAFEVGATKIMGYSSRLDVTAQKALLHSSALILTTIQAQDFPDVVGDTKMGRVTFPIYAPVFSRVFTLFAVVGWSMVLSTAWSLGFWCKVHYCFAGVILAWRYYALRTPQQDRLSYLLFNIWLFMGHLLPCHARWNLLAF